MKNPSVKEQQFLLHLIKGCENFGLTEKESVDAINNILNKNISRRTYYNHKKRLYGKEIFTKLKGTLYDTKEMRCLLLEMEEANRFESLRANKLIAEQFPNRKDIFNDTDKQMEVIKRANERIKAIDKKFEDSTSSSKLNCQSIPENATIREEFVKCGKDPCDMCPHGPYYYAYWKDKVIENKSKLRKRYLGVMDPRQ
ncbi:MAG: hypothetical protein H0X50_06030 [Nitrosopumilus sp.]|nr:hypothetical protein [Nitrosopumilus sp.]